MSEPTTKKAPNEIVDDNTPTRRVRFLVINPQEFLSFFAKGMILAKRLHVLEGVPEDAVVVNMTIDHVRGGIILVVQSDEYEEIPQTQMPPVQMIRIELGVRNATKKHKK